MQPTKLTIWASVKAFLIGTLFGSGGYWKYQEVENSKSKLSTDLRTELSKLMDNVITTTAGFKSLNLCQGKTAEANNRAIELHAKLKLHQENFEVLEKKIAIIEDREVREINLEFSPPCPPTGLSISIN
jgi:hypothetical protein